jgi:hypothetical protein
VAVSVSTTTLEQWANPAIPPCTVPAGAGAVAAGQPETWVMGGGWDWFAGLADPAADPPELFRVIDLTDPAEIILVRDTTAAPDWQVTRGDLGTTPVAHRPGFQVHNIVADMGLAHLAQGVPSGNGLALPAAGRRAAASFAPNAVPSVVLDLPVPAGEAVPGSVYELIAWGYYIPGTSTILRADVLWTGSPDSFGFTQPTFTGLPGYVAGNNRWRAHGLINFYAGQLAHGSVLLQLQPANAVGVQHVDFLSSDAEGAGTAALTGAPYRAQLRAGLTNGNGTLWVQGGKAWRSG